MEEGTTIPSFCNAFPSVNQNEKKKRKEAGNICNNEQRTMPISTLPFSQLLQFEGDAENTEENTLKAEKKPRTKFCDVLHLTG